MASQTAGIEYLETKKSLYAAPGIKMNDVYYSPINSMVEAAEVTFNTGRLRQSLNPSAFGASSSTQVPNQSLLSTTYLHLELPALLANQTLPRGWGYMVIQSVSYQMGSCNMANIEINGATMWQSLAAQAQTSEKLSELFAEGGEEANGPQATGTINEADILLEFPFSNNCADQKKKPVDTSMMNNVITLYVTFKQASCIYGGINTSYPSGFSSALAVFRQGDFANKDLALSNALAKNPELMYTYPIVHKQSFVPASFTGSTSVASPVSLNLTGIINADLVGISFFVVKNSSLQSVGGSCPNPFDSVIVKNITVSFNGLPMFVTPGKLWKVVNMDSTMGAVYYQNSIISSIPGGGLGPFTSSPRNNYIVFIDFSRIRAQCRNSEMFNVWRLGNNTLSISFTTPDTDTYTASFSYNYNGVIEFSNNQSRIYFN